MGEHDKPSDKLTFASLAAHQLKGPVATAAMLLKTLLGEFVGPLTTQQQELVHKAISRCDQALESAQRILSIARASQQTDPKGAAANLANLVRGVGLQWGEEARAQEIELIATLELDPAWVRMSEAVLTEVLEALVSNALKYTPRHGRVSVGVAASSTGDSILLRVGDSGPGIPLTERNKVFEPFYRTRQAAASARQGSGLGLAFVKSAVEAVGGEVQIETSPLGGAELRLTLPVAAEESARESEADVKPRLRVVIVGGSVAGPKAAAKIIRLSPDAEVTIVERNQFMSVSGCGLTHYMSGLVRDTRQLVSTPAGTVRDPVFFQMVKNVRVMSQTEAVAIDAAGKMLRIRDRISGKDNALHYDKLVLATGSSPVLPELPGVGLEGVVALHGLQSAERIKSRLALSRAHDVVIVGGGILGVEITETLVECGCRVTIVEKRPQILRLLDWEMAALVERHLESKGVRVLSGTRVLGFEGDGRVERVLTDQGPLHADLAILAIGFRPDVHLAEEAGLLIGETGAIHVDEYMLTSDPDIYAAGDCVETMELLTQRRIRHAYGSLAAKQGRVVAVNVCGGQEKFPGIVGSVICKVFDYCVARTGLSEQTARSLGQEVVSALVPGPDRDHYMPGARLLMLKMLVDARSRRLLGLQAVGPGAGDRRVDMAAVAVTAGLTVDQVANLDLTHAPPYSPVMDNLITAANVIRNKLAGTLVSVTPMEVHRMIEEGEDFLLLDVRTPAEYEKVRLADSVPIALGTLRSRLDDLPRDKPIVTFCQQSLRGYEAAIVLRAAGFKDVRVMDGGLDMWPYDKIQ